MSSEAATALSCLGLGPIDQVSFAVADIAASLPTYTALFGEFTTRHVEFTPDRVRYRGRPASARLHLAFARSGGLEIELVQIEDGEAPQADHLRDHGEGLHHVRFRVDDLPAKKAEMEALGFETVLHGTTASSGRAFAYLEAPALLGTTVIELIEVRATRPEKP